MIVIDDHKKITWSSGWISSFPTICESFSHVNFNMIQSPRVYKKPYILGQKRQFYYDVLVFIQKYFNGRGEYAVRKDIHHENKKALD